MKTGENELRKNPQPKSFAVRITPLQKEEKQKSNFRVLLMRERKEFFFCCDVDGEMTLEIHLWDAPLDVHIPQFTRKQALPKPGVWRWGHGAGGCSRRVSI